MVLTVHDTIDTAEIRIYIVFDHVCFRNKDRVYSVIIDGLFHLVFHGDGSHLYRGLCLLDIACEAFRLFRKDCVSKLSRIILRAVVERNIGEYDHKGHGSYDCDHYQKKRQRPSPSLFVKSFIVLIFQKNIFISH